MTPDSPLGDAEVAALREALDDEHKAVATYEQVLAGFGDVLPFANVVDAERRHIQALERAFVRCGVSVPDDPWYGRAPRFSSVAEACAAGVAAEIANAAMYDRLLAAGDRDDVREVFANLRSASQENHLPAFRRCIARTTTDDAPAGRRVRRRRRGQ